VLISVYFLLQSSISFFITELVAPQINQRISSEGISFNGFALSVSIITAAPVCIIFIAIFIKLRRSLSFKDYLGFTRPSNRGFIKWAVILLIISASFELIPNLLSRQVIPPALINEYKTAQFLPLFFAAIIIFGPLFEEVLFRGFAFEGIRHSRIGTVGAVFITSLLWSFIHFQYNWYGMLGIFVMGLILGIARQATGSLYIPVAIHCLNNFASIIEIMLYIRFFE